MSQARRVVRSTQRYRNKEPTAINPYEPDLQPCPGTYSSFAHSQTYNSHVCTALCFNPTHPTFTWRPSLFNNTATTSRRLPCASIYIKLGALGPSVGTRRDPPFRHSATPIREARINPSLLHSCLARSTSHPAFTCQGPRRCRGGKRRCRQCPKG